VDADVIPEFHAARILLLMRICGSGSTGLIHGRTKLAKLDFFVRYPRFLELALSQLRSQGAQVPDYSAGAESVEATMIRYRFGPWDHRYFNFLGILIGRNLVRTGGTARLETYSLTPQGQSSADFIAEIQSFAQIVDRCRIVSTVFGNYSGSQLKSFVYDTFVDQIARLPMNAPIIADDVSDLLEE
jgi:hypothetical protein